ncbi:MAG: SDR family NAD(P)-dependent oxidoreductase [Pseudomonadota bacterium]
MKRRALVTGGNRGIGLEIVHGLVGLGHEVLLGGRDTTAVSAAAKKVSAIPLVIDVGDRASIAKAANEAGVVDILVNNAGVLGEGGVLESTDEWERSMAIMVEGPFRLMHHLVPGMIDRGYGRIVNISSGWGAFSDGVAGPGAYGVAKAALNALSVSAARSLPKSVKVNSMCPGWVRTRMGGEAATRSPKKGAETAIWLATLDAKGPTGGFFRDKQPIDW